VEVQVPADGQRLSLEEETPQASWTVWMERGIERALALLK